MVEIRTRRPYLNGQNRGNQGRFSAKMSLLGYSHRSTVVACLPDGVPFRGRLHRYLR